MCRFPPTPTSSPRSLRSQKLRSVSMFLVLYVHKASANKTNNRGFNSSRSFITLQIDNGTTPETLSRLVKEKNLVLLSNLGGAQRIATDLLTDTNVGIPDEQHVLQQRNRFGTNTHCFNNSPPPAKGFFKFVVEALKDWSITLLLLCATLSLVFQIIEVGPRHGWYGGVFLFLAVFVVVLISAILNRLRAKKLQKLQNDTANIPVEVFRGGSLTKISISDVVVGDIVILEIGHKVPADGLLLTEDSLRVDGVLESDSIIDHEGNPFLFSWTNVIDGSGRMLVTSVGAKTRHGEMMSLLTREPNENAPIQIQIDKLCSFVEIPALVLAVIIIVGLFLRFFLRHKMDDEHGIPEIRPDKTSIAELMKQIERTMVSKFHVLTASLVLVLIQTGFPLSAILFHLNWTKRMMLDKAEVQNLPACETIGSATVVILGDIFERPMLRVVKFCGGEEVMDEEGFLRVPNIRQALLEGIGLYRMAPTSIPDLGLSGNIIEKALISWAGMKIGLNMEELEGSHTILKSIELNSARKRCGALIEKNGVNRSICSHWKGAAAEILEICSKYFDIGGTAKDITDNNRMVLQKVIEDMEADGLLSFALACKPQLREDDCGDGNPDNDPENDDKVADDNAPKLEENGLILLGLLGLKCQCDLEILKLFNVAGVKIIFVSEGNITETEIISTDEVSNNTEVLDGRKFRNYSEEERLEIVERIRMMVACNPLDKLYLVQCLKKKGHVVVFTGTLTSDAPVLQEADIGLSIGRQSSEAAKENSDIVLLEVMLVCILDLFKLGRWAYNNIQEYFQLHLTMNIAAVTINFVATIASGDSPLSTFQLLWTSLIVNTLSIFALEAERWIQKLLMEEKQPQPRPRIQPLVTNLMWKNIILQALCQFIILMILHLRGDAIFDGAHKVKEAFIFNAFLLCQVFNEFNLMRESKKNPLQVIKCRCLIAVKVLIAIGMQLVVVEFLKRFGVLERMNWGQWCACIGIAFSVWPIGWVVRRSITH